MNVDSQHQKSRWGYHNFYVVDGPTIVKLSVEAIEASNLVSTSIETLTLIAWTCGDAHVPWTFTKMIPRLQQHVDSQQPYKGQTSDKIMKHIVD